MELRHIFTQNNIVLCFFLNCLFTYFSAGLLFYRSLNEKISLRKCFLLLAFGVAISALYAWVFKYSCQIERGFIRAETINFTEMIACGSVAAAKEKGLLRSEGKEYVVKDGDMIYFRFNV